MKTKIMQLTVVFIVTILLAFISPLLLCAVEEGQDSPFGRMAVFDPSTLTTISTTDKIAWAGEKFRDLGAEWSRNGGETIIWGLIEPEFGKGYDWNNSDQALKRAYENGGGNFNTVAVINPQRAKGGNSDIPLDKEIITASLLRH